MRRENRRIIEQNKILIISGNDAETILLLMPAIRRIREQNRDSRFDIVVQPKTVEILKETGWFDRIIVNNKILFIKNIRALRNEKYKLTVCFQPSLLPYFVGAKKKLTFLTSKLFSDRFFTHESVNYMRLIEPHFGRSRENELYFPISENDREKTKQFLKNNNIPASSTIVAIHTGNPDIADKWDSNNYSKLCDILVEEYNAKIFLFGEPGDQTIHEIKNKVKHKNDIIDATCIKNSRDITAFLTESNLAVTRNGMFLYLACAAKVPTISIFGAGNPYRYGPLGTKYINIHSDMDCFPCNKRIRCRKNYMCIKTISCEKVIEAARLILDEDKQLFLFE